MKYLGSSYLWLVFECDKLTPTVVSHVSERRTIVPLVLVRFIFHFFICLRKCSLGFRTPNARRLARVYCNGQQNTVEVSKKRFSTQILIYQNRLSRLFIKLSNWFLAAKAVDFQHYSEWFLKHIHNFHPKLTFRAKLTKS